MGNCCILLLRIASEVGIRCRLQAIPAAKVRSRQNVVPQQANGDRKSHHPLTLPSPTAAGGEGWRKGQVGRPNSCPELPVAVVSVVLPEPDSHVMPSP